MDKKLIEELNPWFFEVDIKGVGKTIPAKPNKYKGETSIPAGEHNTEGLINHQKYRHQLIVEESSKLFDFKGKTVLDVGCNCGYWSYQYAKLGAKKVIGIEGRENFVNQANLLFSRNEIVEDYKFIIGDALDEKIWEEIDNVDFILCAGLMYHIEQHERLLNFFVNRSQNILIDTRVSKNNKKTTEPDLWFNAIPGKKDKIVPSEKNISSFFKRNGYRVDRLKPNFGTMNGLHGGDNYANGSRITLYARK